MNTDAVTKVGSFLQRIVPQKDASLMIASDATELSVFERSLESDGLVRAGDSLELFKAIRERKPAYAVITKTNAKGLYDIVAQYPTGQVSILNSEYPEVVWASPDYDNGAVVLVATQKTIEEIGSLGMDFRLVAGMAFQS